LGSLTKRRMTSAAYRFVRFRNSSGNRPFISAFYFLLSAFRLDTACRSIRRANFGWPAIYVSVVES
jgi:hypothetical protein